MTRRKAWIHRWQIGTGALAVAGLGCGDAGRASGTEPVAVVDGVVLDATVVRMIAQRDHLEPEAARQKAIETLQLAAAARAEQASRSAAEPQPLLTPARRTQLRRAARARVWLDTVFLPPRTPADIPEDDLALTRALGSLRFVHPNLHRVCQIVVVPADVTNFKAARAISTDPEWLARAHALMDPLAEHVQRYVPAGDPHACTLAGDVFTKLRPPGENSTTDPAITVRFEVEGGFDLTACADDPVPAPGADCVTPQFDPLWTGRIGETAAATWTGVFQAGWGLHLAYVAAIEPARSPDNPQDMAWIRAQVHTAWLANEWATVIESLTQARAVRIAPSPIDAPATDPPVKDSP